MALTFTKLSKPPTSKDEHEWYRWHYRIVELMNGLLSIAVDHGSIMDVLQADDTSSDTAGEKHVTNALVKKYNDHIIITNANPHGTDHSMLDSIAVLDPSSSNSTKDKHLSNAQSKVWQDHTNLTNSNPHGTDHSQLDNVLGAGAYHVTSTEATEITAIDALGAGVVVKTADATYSPRTITGTAGEITVTNGDGIAGNPTIDLPTVISTPRSLGDGTNQSSFEADGTYVAEGGATTWRDIDFPLIARVIGAGTPNYNTLLGNLNMLQWAVNDAEQCSSQEMVHQWKEGSQVVWHIHIVTGGTNVDNRYTQWSIEYTWGNVGTTFPATTTVNSGDLLIPANTPFGTHLVYTVSTWTPTGGTIAAHVKARIKRIASTGTAPTANPFCEMVQLHIEQDTIGSRQVTTK